MKLLSNSGCSEVTVVVRTDISSWVTIPKTSGGTKTTRGHVGECEENSSLVMIVITFEGHTDSGWSLSAFSANKIWMATADGPEVAGTSCLCACASLPFDILSDRSSLGVLTRWPIATGPSQLTDKQLLSGRCCWCWCLHITLYSFGKLLFSNKEGQASISGQWQCHFTVALDMFKWLMTCDEWHKCQPLTPKSGTFQQPL